MTTIEPLQKDLQKIGILIKKKLVGRADFLQKTVNFLKQNRKEILFDKNLAPLFKATNAYTPQQLLQKSDLVLVLGGDGTLLKTATHTPKKRTLILGVNLGNLGFLMEATPEKLQSDLEKIFQRQYRIDQRSLLRITHYRNGQKLNTFLALNDGVINQGSFARLIEMEIEVNQRRVITLKADGLIISSPTGSTGHSLSAGGPIVHPSLPAIIITPICPATLSIRPIILPNNRQIRVRLVTKRREEQEVGLTLDGQLTTQLAYNDEVRIRKSSRNFYLVRVKGQNYYKSLRQKLHWGGGR